MIDRRWLAVMSLGAGLMVAGCGNPLNRFRPVSVSMPSAAVLPIDDDEHAAWAESEPYAVMVRKSCRTLDVYHYGQRIRSFPAVFGLNLGEFSKVGA